MVTFEQLYAREGLVALDSAFIAFLRAEHVDVHNRLVAARAGEACDVSALMLDLAPALDAFVAAQFGIETELRTLALAHAERAPLYACKRLFVQRRAAKRAPPVASPETRWDELEFARAVMEWLEREAAHATELERALDYAAWALHSPEGKAHHRAGVLFHVPEKTDPAQLVPLETEQRHGVTMMKALPGHARHREGFHLTDAGGSLTQALDQAHYCILCHHQGKDSCSKGLHEKDGAVKTSAHGVPLHGCPLEERISEMHELKRQGLAVAALAVACVDNPMIAGTGHRICNDCMKACIYQKQEPVNIPLAETRVLDDVLALPYGAEMYSLLTRWNPMNVARPLPLPESGKRVLVAGLGPAGYTLAHHLLNDGHTVVAVDGLKIEPLPEAIRAPSLIRDVATLEEDLATRIAAGFGGVAEYGITVRWNKNKLALIRLLLERRQHFRAFGGVRFGSQVTPEDAWAMGFDHVALCLGAGKPNMLTIPGGLVRGVRAASDFLMSLQLTGAARAESLANLQLRLPVVVIGGGLTAIDAATEALAYYPVQVEKFLRRVEALGGLTWSGEEAEVAEEFIAHAQALRAADAQGRARLLQEWGGVTIAYRRLLVESPAYRLNHEEISKALEEGIRIAEGLEPVRFEERAGQVVAVQFKGGKELPARTVLVAAGTEPNTVLAREYPHDFPLDGKYFQAVDGAGAPVSPERSPKPSEAQPLLRVQADGRSMSFFGDLHPSFAGNVVKAMASAKQGYPAISRQLAKRPRAGGDVAAWFTQLEEALHATVHAVHRLTPTIVEVVVRAPQAAKHFQPGQFFRLQNMEATSRFGMEGLALTGAAVDAKAGLVSLIVLEMGASSRLCALLTPGERVVLMGPTGTPTEIPEHETVLLAGGGLGNAVLFSIGKAMRARGCRVMYFAGYKYAEDRCKMDEIEAAADQVIWCCDTALLPARRAQDASFQGNIVEAMVAHKEALPAVQRILAIGSDRMMAAVAAARNGVLQSHLSPAHVAIGSINSPMQCMMKEICAQCLQTHHDPETGAVSYVFSCMNQDQALDCVDFGNLRQRLAQNTAQEVLADAWLKASL